VVNDTQKSILDNILKNNTITSEELSSIIGINKRNIEKNITSLKEKRIISRIGSRKSGH